jgi:hypothetical protein
MEGHIVHDYGEEVQPQAKKNHLLSSKSRDELSMNSLQKYTS